MKYYIRYELLCGHWYYMIYKKELFGLFHIFWERYNTRESAITRLNELNHK
jgi:hypothetical protein